MTQKFTLEQLRAASSHVLLQYKIAKLVRREVQNLPKSAFRSVQLAQAKRREEQLKEEVQSLQMAILKAKANAS